MPKHLGPWARAARLQALAQRLCDAPHLTAQGADLMVRLDHEALDLIGYQPEAADETNANEDRRRFLALPIPTPDQAGYALPDAAL